MPCVTIEYNDGWEEGETTVTFKTPAEMDFYLMGLADAAIYGDYTITHRSDEDNTE